MLDKDLNPKKEFSAGGTVYCMKMEGDNLFAGYEGVQEGVTKVAVGQITCWNFVLGKTILFSVRCDAWLLLGMLA